MFISVALLAAASVSAEECTVKIKLVEGLRGNTPVEAPANDPLADVRAQLETLPFSDYRLLSSAEQVLAMANRAVFRLRSSCGDEHALTITPHHSMDQRIDLTVHWTGPKGEELLATKLWVENGKQMVFVSDPDEAEKAPAIVICLTANCVQ